MAQANDYLCGTLSIQVPEGYRIQTVEVRHGSIQNQEYFVQEEGGSFFHPNEFGTQSLLIKQGTGFLSYSRLYLRSYPIDFDLTLTDGQYESSYTITKGTCNAVQLGRVSLEHNGGQPLAYHLIQSQRDDVTWAVHGIDSAYFTPAFLTIPISSSSD